jgi:hypothetical protein
MKSNVLSWLLWFAKSKQMEGYKSIWDETIGVHRWSWGLWLVCNVPKSIGWEGPKWYWNSPRSEDRLGHLRIEPKVPNHNNNNVQESLDLCAALKWNEWKGPRWYMGRSQWARSNVVNMPSTTTTPRLRPSPSTDHNHNHGDYCLRNKPPDEL